VRGFKVRGTTSYAISVSGSSSITIRGNTVTYSGQPVCGKIAAGIKLSNATSSLVTGNTADHNSDSGIYLASGTPGVTVIGNEASWNAEGYQRNANGINVIGSGNFIIGNVLHDNEDSGIQFYPMGNNNLVAANVTYNNGDHGIDNYNVTGGRVIGNTVYRNCTTGINVEGTSGNTSWRTTSPVDNAVYPAYKGISCSRRAGNIGVWDSAPRPRLSTITRSGGRPPGRTTSAGTTYNSLSALQAASRQEAHGIFADPRFVAPSSWNLQLLEGSPAIDSANSGISGEQLTDVLGAPRVDDPAVANTGAGPRSFDDRGAYELQPSTTSTTSTTTTSTTSTTLPPTTTTSATSTSTTSTTLPGGSTSFVTNGGFETDLSGWAPYPSTSVSLVRVSPGQSGNWAVEARNTSSAAISYCTLNDSPNWIRTTQARTYTAAAWVRANTAGATAKLTLSEYSGSTKVGSSAAAVTLSTSWQLISISYTTVAPGSTLDLNIHTTPPPPGQCFQADDISATLS
jgi:parallel beta-helix repeat protein